MRARVIAAKQHMTVYACRRVMFVHDRWTEVPDGYEDEVRSHPLLEIEPEQAEMVMQPGENADMTRRKKGGKQ